MDQNQNENRATPKASAIFSGIGLTDATIYLGIATVAAYMWAYFRELGNKSYYKLPNMFIEMNAETVFKALGETWLALIIFVMAFLGIFFLTKILKPWVLKLLQVIVLTGATFGYYFDILTKPLAVLIILTALYSLALGTLAGMREQKATSFIVNKYVYMGIIFCYFIMSGELIGEMQAQEEDSYLIMEMTTCVVDCGNKPEKQYVIIDSYGSYFIVAPFDAVKKQIIPEYELIEQKTVAQKAYRIKSSTIGPLTVR